MYYQFFMKTRTKNVLFFAKQTGSCKGKGYSLVKREHLGSRLVIFIRTDSITIFS